MSVNTLNRPMSASRQQLRLVLTGGLVLALGACASLPPPVSDVTAEATRECRTFFAQIDGKIEAAGVRDGGAARVAGYPYLRADRFLASYAEAAQDAGAFDAWVQRLRARDQESRRAELRNLGLADADAVIERSRDCGAQLAALELATPQHRADLRERVRVKDDYSLLARTFGFYPAAVPFLNLGIRGYHEEVRSDYARPLADLDSPGPLTAWVPPPAAAGDDSSVARTLAAAPRDALGVPQLDSSQWQALAERHAPIFWIETGGDYDLPGMPVRDAGGRPDVDASRPVVHFRGEYTRFGDAVLPVLVYVVWFSERPPQKSLDSYAGALDGLIWRVVLDPQGQPLTYDTIHPCGCYRYYFPAQPLARIPRGGFWQEPVLFPQDEVPAGRPALRIQSQTHYLRRVVAADDAGGERHTYTLRPYDELLTLPDGKGGTRSLFASDGIVDGTQRGERWWLWITGVPDPGAMRQWGRHATSFVGRSHFDDARFLEQNFALPEWAK